MHIACLTTFGFSLDILVVLNTGSGAGRVDTEPTLFTSFNQVENRFVPNQSTPVPHIAW